MLKRFYINICPKVTKQKTDKIKCLYAKNETKYTKNKIYPTKNTYCVQTRIIKKAKTKNNPTCIIH